MEEQVRQAAGSVHSLETFGLVDGPGVRFVIFLQGCRMRCKYCHNPETWKMNDGTIMTAGELFDKAYRYRKYWGKEGGITISGGEPLWQIDFVTAVFSLAKEKGVHTTIDTSGNPFCEESFYLEKFDRLMKVTDLFMLDIKEMDAEKHKKLTGQENENILALAHYLSEHGKDIWIRHVLVPGITDQESSLTALRDFIKELKTVRLVEILPYHSMGEYKWEHLKIPYSLKGVAAPTEEEIWRAEDILGLKQ